MLLRAITGVIYAQRANDKPSELEHLMMMAEAKAQMALYGSKGVLKATARFFRDHSGINDDESARAFTEIAIAMRKDSFASDYVGFRDDYSALLLGDKK